MGYGPRWRLAFDTLDGVPAKIELWLLGYSGPVEDICGQGTPITLKSDGLSSSIGGQGDIPAAIGRSAEMRWLVPIDTFQAIVAGVQATDRACRCDVYYDGALEFRGFVQPDIYHAPLLSGKQPIELVATDGLATLKDTYFLGHLGQRLDGHRPWLNTILHCLSRCTVALPLRVYTNRRDTAMADADAPELAATSNRAGYWLADKQEPAMCRTVLEALTQALGGTLCQRGGAWEVRSALEAAQDVGGRSYRPAGTAMGLLALLAPTGTITPPPGAGPGWWWSDARQAMQVRPGWKSLTGQTDVGYLQNAYAAGEVFSDRYSWLENQTALRGTSRWTAAPGQVFPLVLTQSAKKAADYATIWPRSTQVSVPDTRYLQGPPLPLVAGGEAVPAYLQFAAQLTASETYPNLQGGQSASPTTAAKAILPYEIVIDGQGTGLRLAEIAAGSEATVTYPLPALLLGAKGATLRLYSWYAPDTLLYFKAPLFDFATDYAAGDVVKHQYGGQGALRLFVARQPVRQAAPGVPGTAAYWAELTATDQATGTLLVSVVGVQLRPQEATWEGEDNFRADGPAGTVRPTEVQKSYHADVPIQAGLYGGNLLAFGKAVGLADKTQSTRWARAIDKASAPLFESNVLDTLALRGAPSRLLTGLLRFRGLPPRLLDSVDAPTDTPGRRYLIIGEEWDIKAAENSVPLVEIGRGAGGLNPAALLPPGARLVHGLHLYAPGVYAPRVRLTRVGKVRVRHL